MLKKIIYCLLLIMGAYQTILFAADNTQAVTSDSKPIVVDRKEAHFTIRLQSNPTTGYRWFIRSYPPDFITPVKHNMAKQDSKLIGAPTQELFEFKIKRSAFAAPHQFIVRFNYMRPFETGGRMEVRSFRILTISGAAH